MPAPAPTHLPDAFPPPTATLLVVDNDRISIKLLGACLRDDGYRVLAATSVEAALSMLAASRFDLILADAFRVTRDPGRNLWLGVSHVRATAGDTPVIILSAHTARSFDGYAQRGFAGLVLKPFDIDALSAVIRRTIDLVRAARADPSGGAGRPERRHDPCAVAEAAGTGAVPGEEEGTITMTSHGGPSTAGVTASSAAGRAACRSRRAPAPK